MFNKELMKGSTAPIVLRLLRDREMYGYEIVRIVNERTGGLFRFKEGTLYPCLHKLEVEGQVSSKWREAPSGKMRRYYRITRKGLAELSSRTAEWQSFSAAVDAVLAGARVS